MMAATPAPAAAHKLMRAGILRAQLTLARTGNLSEDWREGLLDAFSADNPAVADNPVAQLAVRELAAWPSADWEPHSHAGWRASLESWYAAILTCIDDTLDAQRALICQTGMAEEAYASNAAMDRDAETASYRAGLTAAGMPPPQDWLEWLEERVLAWPGGPRRVRQLDAMSDPGYRSALQQLPRYWA
jgi:hypothetical protein